MRFHVVECTGCGEVNVAAYASETHGVILQTIPLHEQ
ncbi:hypothetical protein ABIB51_003006 [Arthrobacter sp. UYCu712]